MFTDLEASTDTTTRLGDDAAAAFFATHDRIVREQLESARRPPREIHGRRLPRAVRLAAQRGRVRAGDPARAAAQQDGPRVRIGVNAGEVREDEGELFGAAINLAARVMDRAAGGEILVTDTVRQLAGTMPDARFRDRGRVALKGFPERQRLHQVRPAERTARASPASTAPQATAPGARRRPARARAGAAAAAIVLVTAGDGEAVDVRPNSVAILDPDDASVIEQVPVGVRPTDVVAGDGSVFVANIGDNTVTQIGARSHRVAGTITPGISVDGLGSRPERPLGRRQRTRDGRRIDPDFRTVASTAPDRGGCPGVAAAGRGDGRRRLDLLRSGRDRAGRSGTEPRRRECPVGNDPSAVAVGAGAVWVADSTDGTRDADRPARERGRRDDPGRAGSERHRGRRGRRVGARCRSRTASSGSTLPPTPIADTVRVAGGPAAVAIGEGAVWVTSRRGGTLTRIDPGLRARDPHDPARQQPPGRRRRRRSRLGGAAGQPGPRITRRRSRRRPDDAAPVDPAPRTDPSVAFPPLVAGALPSTCALLLNYPDRASSGGVAAVSRGRPGNAVRQR